MAKQAITFTFLGFKKEKGFCTGKELRPEDFYSPENIPSEISGQIVNAFIDVLGRLERKNNQSKIGKSD
ncbi:MAG: hypothetical protein H6Q74_525 [Firmicutes bacterium]|nr:hypothetical protein [Bacillota bacterium]